MRSASADTRSIRMWVLCGLGVLVWAAFTVVFGSSSAAHAADDVHGSPGSSISDATGHSGELVIPRIVERAADLPDTENRPAHAAPSTRADQTAHADRLQQAPTSARPAKTVPAVAPGVDTRAAETPAAGPRPAATRDLPRAALARADQARAADMSARSTASSFLFPVTDADDAASVTTFGLAENRADAERRLTEMLNGLAHAHDGVNQRLDRQEPGAEKTVPPRHADPSQDVRIEKTAAAPEHPMTAPAPPRHHEQSSPPRTAAKVHVIVETVEAPPEPTEDSSSTFGAAPQHPGTVPPEASSTGSAPAPLAGVLPASTDASHARGVLGTIGRAGHDRPPAGPCSATDVSPD
ncbi:hypothetical protein ACFWHT_09965 [Microbacterium sp. NPDC058342]|uniref:hypothetical protein n=1 Tax=Microbacterium sp. NPDC058342 TaxID=3346454 RepID=UPI0036651FC5